MRILIILLFFAGMNNAWGDDAPPAPYTLPWQLRPAMVGNAVRLDAATGSYSDAQAHTGGTATASMLAGSYKISPEWAALFKIGLVRNDPPATTSSGTSYTNPVIGAAYSQKFGDEWKATYYLSATIPIGAGSGNTPDAGIKAANATGILMRSAMDNSLFAVNYMALIPGADVAYVRGGWTFQAEVTLFQLFRVKGENVDKDARRTNFTTGIAAGYAFAPFVSGVAELRYQRWLVNDTVFAASNPAVENMSAALGPRFQFKWGDHTLKPGIAYVWGMMGAMSSGRYGSSTNNEHIVFLDLPVSF